MRVTIGIDIACRAAHQASCADESGALIWSGVRFRTEAADLERLWARVPDAAEEVVVVMEPTRNAWVPLAAWFRRRGAGVVMVPSERSADLRAYYAKHTKTDRLDSRVLARLPLLHPEGLHREHGLGPGDALRRAVKLRSSLVHRRIAALHRLDALLEILGPAWIEALHSAMDKTALRFLAAYADPHDVLRLGPARLTRFCYRHSRGAWGEAKAAELIAAARATLALWGADGLDFPSLAEDIALEARLALQLTDEIHEMSERIAVLYRELDPDGIVLSAPGWDRSWRRRFSGGWAMPAASRASPACAPTRDSCRGRTPPGSRCAAAGRPRPATPACAKRSTWPPTRPARAIRLWRRATSGSWWRAANTTARRCARSRRCCSRGSPPACAADGSTSCATSTDGRSTSPKAAPSAPNATACRPR